MEESVNDSDCPNKGRHKITNTCAVRSWRFQGNGWLKPPFPHEAQSVSSVPILRLIDRQQEREARPRSPWEANEILSPGTGGLPVERKAGLLHCRKPCLSVIPRCFFLHSIVSGTSPPCGCCEEAVTGTKEAQFAFGI